MIMTLQNGFKTRLIELSVHLENGDLHYAKNKLHELFRTYDLNARTTGPIKEAYLEGVADRAKWPMDPTQYSHFLKLTSDFFGIDQDFKETVKRKIAPATLKRL